MLLCSGDDQVLSFDMWIEKLTLDQQYIMRTVITNVETNEAKWRKAHPKLKMATVPGTPTTTTSEAMIEETKIVDAATEDGWIELFNMHNMAVATGKMWDIEVVGLNLTPPFTLPGLDPELERRQTATASMQETLSNPRNGVLRTLTRIEGDLGPTARMLVRRGTSGIRGLMRTLARPDRTRSAVRVLEEDVDQFIIDELDENVDWDGARTGLQDVNLNAESFDRAEEIELQQVNRAQRFANGVRRRLRGVRT